VWWVTARRLAVQRLTRPDGSADSVAIIEQALHGRTRIFPLMMRGDAKAAFISVVARDLLPHMDEHPLLREALDQVVRALIKLPNDIQVEPHETLDALDRIHESMLATPFWSDRKERRRLQQIKRAWELVYAPFEAELRAVGGLLAAKQGLKKQQSTWRL
jgi:hypothetical protein